MMIIDNPATGEFWNAPCTCGNPHPEKFACDVREGGWLIDRRMHATLAEAEAWGRAHAGAMSQPIGALYVQIEQEKQAEAGH